MRTRFEEQNCTHFRISLQPIHRNDFGGILMTERPRTKVALLPSLMLRASFEVSRSVVQAIESKYEVASCAGRTRELSRDQSFDIPQLTASGGVRVASTGRRRFSILDMGRHMKNRDMMGGRMRAQVVAGVIVVA